MYQSLLRQENRVILSKAEKLFLYRMYRILNSIWNTEDILIQKWGVIWKSQDQERYSQNTREIAWNPLVSSYKDFSRESSQSAILVSYVICLWLLMLLPRPPKSFCLLKSLVSFSYWWTLPELYNKEDSGKCS